MSILSLVAVISSIISLCLSLYSLVYIEKMEDVIKKYNRTVDEEFHLGFEEP